MNKKDITAAATPVMSPKPVHVRKEKTTIKNLLCPITAFQFFGLFWVKFITGLKNINNYNPLTTRKRPVSCK